jgi:Relaxase/Mobilisation nuclease domain
MIGKIIQGSHFRGLLNYLHDKEGATQISGNMAGATPAQLATEFRVATALNPKISKPVCHVSLSLPKQEWMSDETWGAIASQYVTEMGYENCQYVVYRHCDQDHDHIHIALCRIRFTDGKTVSDSWEKRRAETVIRQLETCYQLTPVQPSCNSGKSIPTTDPNQSRDNDNTQRTGNAKAGTQHLGTESAKSAPLVPRLQPILPATPRTAQPFGEQDWRAISQPDPSHRTDSESDSELSRISPQTVSERGISDLPWHPGSTSTCEPVSLRDGRHPDPLHADATATSTHRETPNSKARHFESRQQAEMNGKQLWQRYSQNLSSNEIGLGKKVARKAFADGHSIRSVVQMLRYSPVIKEMIHTGKTVDQIKTYINHTVREAYHKQQTQAKPQRSSGLEL